jgi:hypothetical protein
MGGAVDDRWPHGLTDDLAAMLSKARDPRRHQHAPDHEALPRAAADGLDASLVPVHRDAAQALASQHSSGRLLDQLLLGWRKLLADNAPPALAAFPEIVPNDLVAERPPLL